MEQVCVCVCGLHINVCMCVRSEFGMRVCARGAPGRDDEGRAASDSEKESRETRCHTDTGDGRHR